MSTSLINKSVNEPLRDEFISGDEEYRYAYVEDFLNTYIATQIRVLREQRGLKQEELAEAIGTKQSGISRLENVNHSRWKTETLRKVARALNVRLKISFETFGSLLGEDANFSKESLKRPKFEDDPFFVKQDIQAIASNTGEVVRSQLHAVAITASTQPGLPFDQSGLAQNAISGGAISNPSIRRANRVVKYSNLRRRQRVRRKPAA
jgi:transcriptional regulator with XRE-family HTH domain